MDVSKPYKIRVRDDPPLVLWAFVDAVEKNLDKNWGNQELADATGYSLTHIHRVCQATFGMPPKEYFCQRRLWSARHELLAAKPRPGLIDDIRKKYGFATHSHFSRRYKDLFGETPRNTLHKIENPDSLR